jgi:hypothetical protein
VFHRRQQLVLMALSCLRRRLSIGVDKGAVGGGLAAFVQASHGATHGLFLPLHNSALRKVHFSPSVTSSPQSMNHRPAVETTVCSRHRNPM